MKNRTLLSVATILLLSASSLHAIKFETLGYKAISMGGASVASSSSSVAVYNNPALLAKSPYTVEVSLSGGIGAYDHGVGASVQKLDEIGFGNTARDVAEDINTISDKDKVVLTEGTEIILDMNGQSLTVTPQGYLGASVKGFGFGVFTGSDTAATAIVSEQHDKLYFKVEDPSHQDPDKYYDVLQYNPSDIANSPTVSESEYKAHSVQYAMDNGLTYLKVKGAVLGEVPIGYGHKFETNLGDFMVGGALKFMEALTYTDRLKIDQSGEEDNAVRKEKQSANFGVDLGFAYQPSFSYDLTFGLVAKNINAPEFDYQDGSKYKVNPLVRTGVAYSIFDSLEVAADLDLTKNALLNDEVDSQMLGAGINYEPFSSIFALSLRGGLMHNLDTHDKAGLIYTAGLGIGVKWFQLDLSGQMSGGTSTVEGYSVPLYSKVNLALVSRW